jgi:hypothetical protein
MSSLMRGGESHGYDIRGSLLVGIRVQVKGMGCAGAFCGGWAEVDKACGLQGDDGINRYGARPWHQPQFMVLQELSNFYISFVHSTSPWTAL